MAEARTEGTEPTTGTSSSDHHQHQSTSSSDKSAAHGPSGGTNHGLPEDFNPNQLVYRKVFQSIQSITTCLTPFVILSDGAYHRKDAG